MLVGGLMWFEPTENELFLHKDGGVAIIDQWIASHGKYFIGTAITILFISYQFYLSMLPSDIGTAESTFSFRIREDRQFMGFSQNSTYNNLCGPEADENDPHSCDKPSFWRLVEAERSPHQEL